MKDKVIIVGGGPAGLSAGLYAARSGLSATILEKGYPGGLAVTTDLIDNYPGFPSGVKGMELGDKMREHAERFGARIVNAEVEKVWSDGGVKVRVKGAAGEGGAATEARAAQEAGTAGDAGPAGEAGETRVKGAAREGAAAVEADAAIVATGWSPRKLGVPGEEELTGKGVSYCATCDGPLYRNKVVAVVGGGDSALQEAIFLARFAGEVKLIHRREEFRAAPFLQKTVAAAPNITPLLSMTVAAVLGGSQVEGLELESVKTGARESLSLDGVFFYVGIIPNTGMLGPEFERDETGFVLTDDRCRTSVRGVFAAGDVRSKSLRQVVTAAGDGALAAMSAYAYLEHQP